MYSYPLLSEIVGVAERGPTTAKEFARHCRAPVPTMAMPFLGMWGVRIRVATNYNKFTHYCN
jgi:hypothetical protein